MLKPTARKPIIRPKDSMVYWCRHSLVHVCLRRSAVDGSLMDLKSFMNAKMAIWIPPVNVACSHRIRHTKHSETFVAYHHNDAAELIVVVEEKSVWVYTEAKVLRSVGTKLKMPPLTELPLYLTFFFDFLSG